MGNTQSNGRSHRLSKPKTNTNSPFGTPKIESPVSVYSRFANSSLKDRQPLYPQLKLPVESNPQFEFGSDEHGGFGELASHVQARLSSLSRSNSAASQGAAGHGSQTTLTSLPGSKLSLVSQSQNVDLDTAVKLLQEVRKTASPEDLNALRKLYSDST